MSTRFDYDGFDEFASFYKAGALSDDECRKTINAERCLEELHNIIDELPEESLPDVLELVKNYY